MNKMDRQERQMLDRLDAIAFVQGEMVKGQGEDGYLVRANESMVIAGVFDGCGGLGAKKYPSFNNHTGAYIGARAAAGAVYDWFEQLDGDSSPLTWKDDVKNAMKTGLTAYKKAAGVTKGFKGSMVKDFPTTAAFFVCRQKDGQEEIHFFWAGDSRGYLLTDKGLVQMTSDDTDGEDAMSNLSHDGVLNNVISASADFVLHERVAHMSGAYIVLNSTDGYFNYLPSPMHFEFFLLSTLLESDSVSDWEKRLAKEIREYTGDDHTLSMAVFGYRTFEKLKKSYGERRAYLHDSYIASWEKHSEEEKQQLWLKYKAEQGNV